MIAKRASQLLRAVKQVKRLEFRKAAKTLGITMPKGFSRKKQFSSNWLEFHFGWAPLFGDIGAAVKTLQDPLPNRKIRMGSTDSFQVRTGPYPQQPNPGFANEMEWWTVSVRSGCRLVLTNPDLYLANQLGFTNPATVAWELVPYSFIVDWFIPIGEFLSAMTATLGLEIVDGWYSHRIFYQRHRLSTSIDNIPLNYFGWSITCLREVGAISPFPSLRPHVGFSPTRALTAVTLLIQHLK
jgi:hypothetical protein